MPINNSQYPFDPTGTAASNLITGEQQIITAVNYKDYQLIVPKMAPYFLDSLQLSFRDPNNNVVPLTKNVDWYETHWFISASRATAKPVYGSFTLLNRNLAGVITMRYQTLGGDWNIDEALIAQIMADRLHNPRTTSWESVSEQPYAFPVIDHEWDLVDMVGMSEVVVKLGEIRDAILASGEGNIDAHIANTNNPHQTTAAQLNLGNVRNITTANQQQAEAGTSDDVLMTPLRVHQYYTSRAGQDINAHIANTNNPHQTSAAQTGAYTTAQVDQLLLGKLNSNGTANNSVLFDGRTPSAFTAAVLAGTAANATRFENRTYAEAKTDILSGTAFNSARFVGMDLQDMTNYIDGRVTTVSAGAAQARIEPYNGTNQALPYSWTRLATFLVNPVGTLNTTVEDPSYIVNGGEDMNALKSSTYIIGISARDSAIAPAINVLNLVGDDVTVTFGITRELDAQGSQAGTLWMRSAINRNATTITAMSNARGAITSDLNNSSVAEVEPVGIVYSTGSSGGFATKADLAAVLQAMTTTFNNLANS